MTQERWQVAHLDQLEAFSVDDEGLTWHPVRRHFGIAGFGVNAYAAARAGDRVVEEHTESSGHEELYVVVSGRATFTLDGEDVEARAGTFVFVRDHEVTRGAVAAEDGTAVVAVGAKPGTVFEPSPWELWFVAEGYRRAGDEANAREAMEQALAQDPDHWAGPYQAARFEVRMGRYDEAVEHLRRAVELDPDEMRRRLERDRVVDPLRDHPRFPHVS